MTATLPDEVDQFDPASTVPEPTDTTAPRPGLARQLLAALPDALRRLDPRSMVRNPVMFVVEVVSALSTGLVLLHPSWFGLWVVVWLWLTVIFANLADAVAEGRGKAQAAALRQARTETVASRLEGDRVVEVASSELRPGDLVVVQAGQVIPGDGDVVEGVASVDESAITGESAPVIREAGGDRSAVTGGTTVLSDRIVVRITTEPGQTFLDKMIALVEGANRQRTPNEIALTIVLSSLSIIFMLVVLTITPLASFSGAHVSVIVLVCLLVCLIPTTIGGLLSAIGIAGMDRLVQRNVLATSGRAVEAAGDVNTLLLDKTGTITLGNRRASDLFRVPGVSHDHLARAAHLASAADGTPEGRSIISLVEQVHPESADHALRLGSQGRVSQIEFSATTRMSGIDLDDGTQIRKGAPSAVIEWVHSLGGQVADDLQSWVEETDVDGFNLAYAVTHETFRDVVELLIPELQKRGVFKQDYRQGTLREKLFGAGPRLTAPHPGADYRRGVRNDVGAKETAA